MKRFLQFTNAAGREIYIAVDHFVGWCNTSETETEIWSTDGRFHVVRESSARIKERLVEATKAGKL